VLVSSRQLADLVNQENITEERVVDTAKVRVRARFRASLTYVCRQVTASHTSKLIAQVTEKIEDRSRPASEIAVQNQIVDRSYAVKTSVLLLIQVSGLLACFCALTSCRRPRTLCSSPLTIPPLRVCHESGVIDII
jgi:hypothetical protein